MSFASNTLYLVRDNTSSDWMNYVTPSDALLLIEDGVYRSANALPESVKVFTLASDAKARAVTGQGELIDHEKWVTLALQFSKTVRL